MFVLDITNPLTLLLLLVASILLIFLGKEIKKPIPTLLSLVFFLALVLVHTIQLTIVSNIPEIGYEVYKTKLLYCLAVDLTMIFITFFGYLWVDDIACEYNKKKSIDNSLDWLWKKI